MVFVEKIGAIRVFRNDVEVSPDKLPEMFGLADLFRAGGNEIESMHETKTSDVLRYGHRSGRLPFTVTFTDRYVNINLTGHGYHGLISRILADVSFFAIVILSLIEAFRDPEISSSHKI